MKTESIVENSSIELDDKHAELLNKILDEASLPLLLEGNMLSFDEYTVGQLTLGDLTINILPRNPALKLSNYFEMLTYIEHEFDFDLKSLGFKDDGFEFNLTDLSQGFFKICSNLINFGLTGVFIKKNISNIKLSGEINFDKFNKFIIPIYGVPQISSIYSINTGANQLIKSAINKILSVDSSNTEGNQLLKEFDVIDNMNFTYNEAKSISYSFISSNPYYHLTLEYAIKVLFGLKLEFKNGEIEWYAFLENSNSVFEKYVRKILQLGLDDNVSKWKKPKKFAKLKNNNIKSSKSYSPDILLNYCEKQKRCDVVLDVKNKTFFTDISKSSNIVSSSDMYQIIFYCNQLRARVGCLIYPTSETIQPISIDIDNQDLKIYLLSVNMSLTSKERQKALLDNIKKFIHQQV